MKISAIDREIIKFIQGDLPIESHPFLSLAQQLNLSEDEIIARIKVLQEKGMIRRFAAILSHYRAGFTANAMVAWRVEELAADSAGAIMAEYKEVSHCYLRDVPKEFGYNLFSMIHAGSEEELKNLVEDIAWRTGLDNYVVIKSIKELKKVSMKYI